MKTTVLQSYVEGRWVCGSGNGRQLSSAIDGSIIALADSSGIDFASLLHYGRTVGGSAIREMTFHQRGRMLKKLALHLLSKKDHFYQISYNTGATKSDSWIDIEGGIGNLFVMSSKGRREMPDTPFFVDGKVEGLSKGGSFVGQHIYVPKGGIAVHINAFNFPVWGMLEKIAVNLLAGMPCVVKPATITSYLTEAVVKEIVASNILPQGCLQLICGSASGIVDHLEAQDVVTFTGSADTGIKLKSHPNIGQKSIPFNMEADSLNCCILGPDATPDTEDFKIFIKEVAREMTVKAGQKCTAIRRTIVPENMVEDVRDALVARLKKTSVGDPRQEGVRMGPLASHSQVEEVRERVAELQKSCQVLYRGEDNLADLDGNAQGGAFFMPHLLYCESPTKQQEEKQGVHNIEAFGPVSTIIPYSDATDAAKLANLGGGSLVASVVTSDSQFTRQVVLSSAHQHGRFLVLNSSCAKESTGHGSPMPQLVHGGPGRAGGGEEMGGIRGVFHYMQRTALQGHPDSITSITKNYCYGGNKIKPPKHPFRLYFEELQIGHSITTDKREISREDIDAFADLSGDHFYAHKEDSDFANTLFDSQVAHGYLIISAAAGLFVDPEKGPVLANYGIDEFRFTKPMYVGDTMQVELTVAEKIAQEDREGEIPRGIVKWQVEVFDRERETAALGTILTLVAKKGTNKGL